MCRRRTEPLVLNQLKVIAAFLAALAAGNATFFVTVQGVKYSVNLLKNNVGQAPNLSAIMTLANAALGMMFAGVASSPVKIGANTWTVTVAKA